ncbi:hypothetical protein AX16_004996 [Volvariella volvacea WC 439]|nr:hypothetical protein AX16_004996 [Volvariella volvacea WC 439]
MRWNPVAIPVIPPPSLSVADVPVSRRAPTKYQGNTDYTYSSMPDDQSAIGCYTDRGNSPAIHEKEIVGTTSADPITAQFQETILVSAFGVATIAAFVSLVHDIVEWQGDDRRALRHTMHLGALSATCHITILAVASLWTSPFFPLHHRLHRAISAKILARSFMGIRYLGLVLFVLSIKEAVPLIFKDQADIITLTWFAYLCLILLITQSLLRFLESVEFWKPVMEDAVGETEPSL